MSHMEESFEMDAGQEEFLWRIEEGNSIVTVEK